jgi:methylmalonyl-CoA/ethylmalonyl-CoA epimerase
MDTGFLGNNVITQIGIVVADIEKSARDFARFLGAPIPSIIETDPAEKAQTQNRGSPTAARARLAFIRCGGLDLKLIEPDREPSTWREFLDQHGEGVHHIAFVIKDMDNRVRTLQAEGHALLQKGEYTGGRYAYMDTSRTLKTIVELLQNDA